MLSFSMRNGIHIQELAFDVLIRFMKNKAGDPRSLVVGGMRQHPFTAFLHLFNFIIGMGAKRKLPSTEVE